MLPETPGFSNDDELGALWEKHGAQGPYMTGKVAGQPVVVFLNKHWTEGSKAPKWRVLKPQPKIERTAPPPQVADDDSIPF